jgi:hypothetical protein
MIAHGWKLYVHHRFERQYRLLVESVGVLAAKDPIGYQQQPLAKLLSAVQRLIFERFRVIPMLRSSVKATLWVRITANGSGPNFISAYRLFFRFSSKEKVDCLRLDER